MKMRIIKKENIYMEKVNIRLVDGSNRPAYFVCGDNNSNFGSFGTEQDAMKQFNFILSVPREDRHRLDQ